jgi:hypothetical protein
VRCLICGAEPYHKSLTCEQYLARKREEDEQRAADASDGGAGRRAREEAVSFNIPVYFLSMFTLFRSISLDT